MKPYQINLLNAVVLIAMSAWGYFGSESPSPTAFIPAAFGVIFLLMNGPFKNENKVVAHIVVLLTFLLIIALAMPFRGAMGRGDTAAMVRVGIMLATSIVAMVIYVKSFIDARKARG